MRNAIFMVAVCTLASLISPGVSADMKLIVHEITGEVVDTSGAPIPNAYVIVKWDGAVGGWGEGGNRCTRSTSVQADGQGRFIIPAWTKDDPGFVNLSGELAPYRPGFTNVGWGSAPGAIPKTALGFIPLNELELPPAHVKLLMKRFEGSALERRDFLSKFLGSTVCGGDDISGTAMIYEAIEHDIRELPKDVRDSPLPPGGMTMTIVDVIRSHIRWANEGSKRIPTIESGK